MSAEVVLARKSYDHLLRTRDRALRATEAAQEDAERARKWARLQIDEQRRLEDRLNRVCMAATAMGVTIQAINAALDGEDEEMTPDQLLAVGRAEGAGAVHGAVKQVLDAYQSTQDRNVAELILLVRDAMQVNVSDPGSECGASKHAWGVRGTCGAPIGHEGAHQ